LKLAFVFEGFDDIEIGRILDLKIKDIEFSAIDQAKRVAMDVLNERAIVQILEMPVKSTSYSTEQKHCTISICQGVSLKTLTLSKMPTLILTLVEESVQRAISLFSLRT
jgi:hypothetical protein